MLLLPVFLRSTERKKDGKTHRYFSVVENRRLPDSRTVQRTVLYLGEINDQQQAAWRKTLEVFDEDEQDTRTMSLFPDDREVPPDVLDSMQVKLSGLELRRPRTFGNCWLGCELWHQLGLDEFWRQRLPEAREAVSWEKVLQLQVVNCLLDPGSEFRLHRQWFVDSAMDELLETDFAVAAKDRLYRCLDRVLPHKQELFVWLKQKWADLFHSDFEVLLYDLTSTYFEGEMEQNPKAKRGYSRDKRPDCLQLVIALVVTTDGLPLAYEVMKGNTSDRTTLPAFLKKIEDTYGKARRVWVMDRGVPTEAILKDMRQPDRQTFYLVGTPKSKINQHEKKWLDLPWQKVRDSVEVKLYEHENELYVLAKSGGRQAKEMAHAAQAAGPPATQTAGDAPKPAPARSTAAAPRRRQERSRPGLLVCQDSDAGSGSGGHSRDVRVSGGQSQAESRRTTRRTLSAAQQPHWGRSGGVVDAVCTTDADRGGVPLVEKRTEHPAHPSSTGKAGRRARSDCVSGLLSASHFEEPPDDARARVDAGRGVRKAGDDPDGGGVDSPGGWPLAGHAASHPAGKRRAGITEPDPDHPSLPTAAAHQGLPDYVQTSRRPACFCGEDLWVALTDSEWFSGSQTPEVRRLG
jgi:hypothetical protein